MLGSLRSRLALSNLAVTLLALLVLTFVFTQLLRQHSIDEAQSFINQQASLVQRDVDRELPLAYRNTVALGAFYGFFAHDSHLLNKRVIFFSKAGNCGFDSSYYSAPSAKSPGPIPNGCQPTDSSWLVVAVSSRRPASKLLKVGPRTYLVSQRPTSRGTSVVLITDASSLAPSFGALAPAFLLAAIASGLIWLGMAIYFAYAVSRPLGRIADAARAMAAGDYSQSVEVPGRGEIGELGSSFNHMVTQVRASNQLLRDFVANVSHDLRTPLTIISGYAGSILDGTAQGPEEVHEATNVIAQEAAWMQRLIDNLLQLTRLESGLRKFQRQPTSIRAVAEKTIWRSTAARDGRTVSNRVPDALPLALVDEELLERAMMNLLSNALEYTAEGGTVEVGAAAEDGWIEVSVKDSGIGIPVEEQGRVFERFYRGDRSRRREDGHSGLGLPIVKEIVEAHGGAVRVESSVGRGTTFRFTIPAFRPS